MTTEWRPSPDFPNYLVSSEGQVRRILRDKHRRCGDLGRILRPSVADGYLHVILMRDRQRNTALVNRLVAHAFLGVPPSPEHQAAHWDGNRQNNRASNLRWASPLENQADKLRHRTLHVRTWNSKLSETDIERVRDMACCGISQKRIGAHFDVQPAYIGKVVRGLKWRQHLTMRESKESIFESEVINGTRRR